MIEKLKCIRYNRKYKEQVLCLLKEQKVSLEKFFWRYENSPYKSNLNGFLAIIDNKVVGFKGIVYQKFRLFDNVEYVCSPCDAFVHPNFRKLGVMSELNKFMLKSIREEIGEDAIILNLSSNELSTPINLKQGWQPINSYKQYLHKICLRAFFKLLFKKLKINSTQFSHKVYIEKYSVEVSPLDDSAFNEIQALLKMRKFNKLTNIRDISYFKWRYSFQKDLYTLVICRNNDDKMTGYLILKRDSYFKFFLAEYYVESYKVLGVLIKYVERYLIIPWLCLFSLTTEENDIRELKTMGFFEESKFLQLISNKKRLPALVRLVKNKAVDSSYYKHGLDIRDYLSWNIQFSDLH